jgi:hypothetical protein
MVRSFFGCCADVQVFQAVYCVLRATMEEVNAAMG